MILSLRCLPQRPRWIQKIFQSLLHFRTMIQMRRGRPPTPNFQRRRPARLAGFPFSPSPRCKDPISAEMSPARWEGRYYKPHAWEKNDISRNESSKEPDPIDNPYTPEGGKRMFARR